MTHPDDRDRSIRTLARAHDPRGDGLMTLESRIIRPGGEVRHVSTKSQTHFDEAGRPRKTVGTLFDVTERLAPRRSATPGAASAGGPGRRAPGRGAGSARRNRPGAVGPEAEPAVPEPRRQRPGRSSATACTSPTRCSSRCATSRSRCAPSVLDDLGLGAAVQWYVEQTAARTGRSCRAPSTRSWRPPHRPLKSPASACCRRPSPTCIAMPQATRRPGVAVTGRDRTSNWWFGTTASGFSCA